MRDEGYLSKNEYIEILKALDHAVCILDRSEKRANLDNRAYSLVIACAKADLISQLTSARKLLAESIPNEVFLELDNGGVFDYEIPEMPYESSLDELRELLKPYFMKYIA